MTLTEIVDAHPDLFYEGNGWWRGQKFAVADHRLGAAAVPLMVTADRTRAARSAASLAMTYAHYSTTSAPFHFNGWWAFLWTADTDDYGQQIYVGGVGQFGIDKFQIHRHLRIDDRWVTPL